MIVLYAQAYGGSDSIGPVFWLLPCSQQVATQVLLLMVFVKLHVQPGVPLVEVVQPEYALYHATLPVRHAVLLH